jgi:predicted XRE-type DNA-binding protein
MLTFEVPLVRVRMGGRVGFSESRQQPLPKRASPMARSLALGHRIVAAVENGEVRGYSEVAQRMGVSQPRVSMLVAMTFLSPRIQIAILFGEGDIGFRTLLKLARMDGWKEQEAMVEAAPCAERNWGSTSRMVNATPEFAVESRPNSSQNGATQALKEGERGGRQVKRTPRRRPAIPLSA